MGTKKFNNLVTGEGLVPSSDSNVKKLSNLAADYKLTKNRGGIAGGLEYVGASLAAGVGGVFEGTYDLVAGSLAALTGNKAYAENLFGTNVVGEWHKNITDGYNPNKAMKFVGDVSSGLGQSATMLIPYAGPVLFYAGAIGGGIGSATEKTGELGFKEYAYGTTVGVIEGLLETYLGSAGQALDKVTKGATKSLMTKLTSNVAKDWAASAVWKGVAKDLISNAAGEFFEEAISEAIDPVLQRGFRIDQDASTSMKEILYAGLVGFGSGLVMGGASTAISTGTAYKAGKRSIDNGNAEAVVRGAHTVIDALKIDENTKDIAPYLEGLKSSLESYELAADKTSDAATIYLGQVQGYMSAVESSWAVLQESIKLAGVSENAAKSFAEFMSYADKVGDVSKNYTAEDWYSDKNKIRTRYAAFKWAGAFLGDTVEMAESVAFDEEIRADREGRAVGTPVVQDIADAAFTGESGTYNVALGEGKTSPEGDYMRIMKLGEDSYSIARGNSSEQVRGYRGLTREVAQAEFERIKGAVATERSKVAQNQNWEGQSATDNNVGGKVQHNLGDKVIVKIEPNPELEARIANSSESKYDVIRQYLIEQFEGQTFTMSDGRTAIMDRSDAKKLSSKADKKRTAQLGNLRDLVEKARYDHSADFADHNKFAAFHYYAVTAELAGSSIDLWINVGTAKNDGINHIYSITNNREDAPTKSGVSGLTEREPRVQSASSIDSISQSDEKSTENAKKSQIDVGNPYSSAIMNAARRAVKNFDMLTADQKGRILRWMQSVEGKGIDADVVSGVANIIRLRPDLQVMLGETKEGVAGFRAGGVAGRNLIVLSDGNDVDLLRETIAHELGHEIEGEAGYEQIKKAALAATSKEERDGWARLYRKTFPNMSDEDVDAEIASKTLGRRLATPRFVERFANRSIIRRAIDFGKMLLDALRADDAGRLEIAETEKLIDMMNRALQGANVQALGESGGKRYNVTSAQQYSEYNKPINLSDIGVLRPLKNKNINNFTSEDIEKTQKWAYKFYKELGAKSPFFRAWFGEWRAHDKKRIEIVSVPTIDISQAHLEHGNYTISDTGWEVHAGKVLNDDTRHHTGGSRVNVKSLNAIEAILKNSVLLDTLVSEPDTNKKSENTAFLHKLYTMITYNGQTYIAKTTVEEFYNETTNRASRRAYNLKAIKIEPAGGQLGTSSSSSIPDASSINSIADLYGFVKQFDKEFTPAPEVSEYVLNEDGTPKVFYHGSDELFTTFGYDKIGSATGVGILGEGFYFTDQQKLGKKYGKNVYKVFLQMSNPYMASQEDLYRLNTAKLEKQGYDGVILKAPNGNIYMALDNTQIKSATDNIGTFDRNNPDIRYNLTEAAAEQAARDAADTADQREKELRRREQKAAKAERDAEIKRIETRARDYNAYYYKYDDIKALIDTINKEAKLGFTDVSDAAFAAFSQLNAFRAEVYKADYRQSFLETTTDYLIEAADAQAGRELKLSDVDRRRKVYKMLNEAYERLAKVTPKQKTEGRRARAEAEAQFQHKTAELHMLLNRVDQRNFRIKTAGIIEGEAWKTVTKTAKAMRTRGANIQFGAMKDFAEAFTSYLKAKATSLYNAAKDMTEESLKEWNKQVADGDNELYKRINLKTAQAIIEFAESNDIDFTDANIAATVAALKTVLAVDAYTDRFINEKGEAIDAETIVAEEIDGMRKSFGGVAGKLARTTFGKALQYGIYNVISPETVAHRMDGILGAGHLFRGIRAIQRSSLDAQYDQMKWMMPITEFIRDHKKKDKSWWKEWQNGTVTITYTLPFGRGETKSRTITLTKGEAASLYLTSKREQAKAALALGRISVTDAEGRSGEQFSHRRFNMDAIDEWLDQNKFEAQTDEEVNAVVLQLQQAMDIAINGMYSQFSATDKAFIEQISKFYQTTSKNVKQACDTRYYGSTNVFNGFYYPIARSGLEFDFDFIGSNMRGLDDVSLRNYPFNKSTVKGARTQLQINDILVVLDRHSRQLAMYKNLTIPMQNLRLIYNHKLTEGVSERIDTVRKYINEYIWSSKNGRGGFDQWIGDFSNAAQKRNIGGKTEFDTVLDKIQGGYVVAALGLNPSSIAKQWSTIMQMVEEVPPHIWMKAYAPAENKDMMLEKSRYASVRKNNSEIYFAQGTTAKLNDAMSYTLKGLEAGDYFVNLRMWNMAQYYVAETKGLALNSEENLTAAGKVLDEWILRFQDTSDASTKSALQRHPQKLAQAITMFTSAPMKKFSAWYTHLTDAIEADRLIKSGKLSDEDRKRAEKILAESKKKLAKSSTGIVAAAAFETTVTLVWAALRGKDDEDEEKKKSLVAKVALETSANVIGIVPVAGQIAESLMSGYDIDNMYESIINDGIGTVRTTYQLSAKALAGEKVESEAVMRNARSWAYLMSQALGVPVRNFNNVFQAGLTVISPIVPQAKYRYDAIFYEPTYAADMSKALKSGKTELAEVIYRMAQKDIKTGGAAADAVVSEMVRLYGEGHNVLPRSAPTTHEDAEGNTVKLKAAQVRRFSEIYGTADGVAAMVATSPVYAGLSDELKAKALRVSYEVYHSRAKSEVLGSDLSVIAALSYLEDYIDVPTLISESAYIYGIKSTKDAKRSELVKSYISGYSAEAQAILLYAAGYRSEQVKELLASVVASLDEDVQNRVKKVLDF